MSISRYIAIMRKKVIRFISKTPICHKKIGKLKKSSLDLFQFFFCFAYWQIQTKNKRKKFWRGKSTTRGKKRSIQLKKGLGTIKLTPAFRNE